MRNARRAWWIANFDMEDLIISILRNGTLVSIGLIVIALVLEEIGRGHVDLVSNLQGKNILQFFISDFRHLRSPETIPTLVLHLSIGALLLTSYLRVLASTFYFICVERSAPHAVMSGAAACLLTYLLFLG